MLSTAGLRAWALNLRPETLTPSHIHETSCFHILVRGELHDIQGGEHTVYRPGTAMYHPPGTIHECQAGICGAALLTIDADARWTDRLQAERQPQSDSRSLHLGHSCRAGDVLREVRRPDRHSKVALESFALELLVAVGRAGSRPQPPNWLARAKDLIHDRLGETLTPQSIAAELDVGKSELLQAFRTHQGCPLRVYIQQARVQRVLEMLPSWDLSLATVASMAGFFDQSHCNRVFKSIIGTTPGQRRRELIDGS